MARPEVTLSPVAQAFVQSLRIEREKQAQRLVETRHKRDVEIATLQGSIDTYQGLIEGVEAGYVLRTPPVEVTP